jgi:hypothetical protein
MFLGIGSGEWLGVGSWEWGVDKLAEPRKRKRGEHVSLGAGLDHRNASAVADQQTRGGARAGDGDPDLQAALGGRAPQLLRDRACVAEQSCQAAQVEKDLAIKRFEAR